MCHVGAAVVLSIFNASTLAPFTSGRVGVLTPGPYDKILWGPAAHRGGGGGGGTAQGLAHRLNWAAAVIFGGDHGPQSDPAPHASCQTACT